MAGITLEIAQAKLDKYLAAEERILLGQAVDVDGHRLTRADLEAVQRGVALWDGRVKELTPASSGGGMPVREVIPK